MGQEFQHFKGSSVQVWYLDQFMLNQTSLERLAVCAGHVQTHT